MLKKISSEKIHQTNLIVKTDENLGSLTERVKSLFQQANSMLVNEKKSNTSISYQRHFVESKVFIQQVAAGLRGTALILGVGGANDIPLKNLAEQFDKLILVDIDFSQIQQALKDVPSERLSKIELIEADLAGYFSDLSSQAEEVAKNFPKEKFWKEMLNIIKNVKRKPLNFPEHGVSFVVSSMISSQLSSIIQDYLERLYFEIYKEKGDDLEREKEYRNFAISIETSHLEDLHRWVSPQGKVYFSTDTFIQSIRIEKNQNTEIEKPIGDRMQLPSIRILDERMRQLFIRIEGKTWDWFLPRGNFHLKHTVRAMQLEPYKASGL